MHADNRSSLMPTKDLKSSAKAESLGTGLVMIDSSCGRPMRDKNQKVVALEEGLAEKSASGVQFASVMCFLLGRRSARLWPGRDVVHGQ
jgi:hypothetical protein